MGGDRRKSAKRVKDDRGGATKTRETAGRVVRCCEGFYLVIGVLSRAYEGKFMGRGERVGGQEAGVISLSSSIPPLSADLHLTLDHFSSKVQAKLMSVTGYDIREGSIRGGLYGERGRGPTSA